MEFEPMAVEPYIQYVIDNAPEGAPKTYVSLEFHQQTVGALAAELAEVKTNAARNNAIADEMADRCHKSEARVAALEPALRKCIETFDDMQRVLRLLNRPVLADACAVAADSSRDALMPPPATYPYPNCRQKDKCRGKGSCHLDPTCGD